MISDDSLLFSLVFGSATWLARSSSEAVVPGAVEFDLLPSDASIDNLDLPLPLLDGLGLDSLRAFFCGDEVEGTIASCSLTSFAVVSAGALPFSTERFCGVFAPGPLVVSVLLVFCSKLVISSAEHGAGGGATMQGARGGAIAGPIDVVDGPKEDSFKILTEGVLLLALSVTTGTGGMAVSVPDIFLFSILFSLFSIPWFAV